MLVSMPAGDDRPRSRGWAAAGTIAVHALVGLWLLTRPPEPPPPPVLQLHEIELVDAAEIPIANDGDASKRAPEPGAPEPESEATPPDEEPSIDDGDPRESTRRPSRAEATHGDAEPLDTTPEPEPHAAAAEGANAVMPPGALAISGLRRGSRSGGVGSLRPTLEPPTTSRSLHAVGSDAAYSPEPSDTKPPSLAAAGFKPRSRDGKLVYKHKKFRAVLHPDGRMTFSDAPSMIPSKAGPPQRGLPGGGGGNMPGPGEAAVAMSGQELYVKEKRELLEWTYELRVQMAVEFAEANIDKRLKSLYRELITRWHAPGATPEERRAEIFERWDDCDDSFGPKLPELLKDAPASIDDKRREAGRAARETIEKFVRTHLPEGSADAFTDAELRSLNARRKSRARFDPYAEGE
jgi:hypothetical protein